MSRQKDGSIDQSLLRFEEALTQMAKNGQIDLPIDDEFAEIILNGLEPVDLTENEFRKLSADMLVVHQDRAIEQARALLPVPVSAAELIWIEAHDSYVDGWDEEGH